MLNVETFSRCLQTLALPTPLWVAYSGGMDSHVLLHVVSRVREQQPNLELCAIHVNHGLSERAGMWQAHCQQVCQTLAIKYVTKNLAVLPSANTEAAARQARYRVFEACLSVGGSLLTAHHQDDQAETLLLRMLRGAGEKGLAGIPQQRSLGQGRLVRPLLAFSREQLHQYAEQHQLQWIEDESNQRTHFERNYLRQQIFPLLETRWPSVKTTFAQACAQHQENHQLLEKLAADDWRQAIGSKEDTLSIQALHRLNDARQRNLLRFWLDQQGFIAPSRQQLQQLQQTCLYSQPAAMPLVCWADVEVRRFQDNLYAMTALQYHDLKQRLVWQDRKQALQLPAGLGQLSSVVLNVFGINTATLAEVSIGFRQGGERLKLPGRSHSQSLKKLLHAWEVPPWLRDRVPLIYIDGRLIGVAWEPLIKQLTGHSNNTSNYSPIVNSQ